MRKNLTITIGIPTYNEEKNIVLLLKRLLSQVQKGYLLKEIMIVDDHSEDRTVQLIKQFKNRKIILIESAERRGQQVRQNQLLNEFDSDVLVIIEADTLPASETTIAELVKPFIDNKDSKLAMTVGKSVMANAQSWLERILNYGYVLKQAIFADWKSGINVYTCGGHAMKALSAEFARSITWPTEVPEDAYTYFFLKQSGYTFKIQKGAQAYMRNVTNWKDRIKQCRKFHGGKRALGKFFAPELLRSEYLPPLLHMAKHVYKSFVKNPPLTILVIGEMVFNRLLTWSTKTFDALYVPYYSSKKLNTTS